MSGWTLQDIRTKLRRVTGRLSPQEITDQALNDYINRFYQYTLPAELKLEKLHTYYEFLTEKNQAWYDLPETVYTNYEPPATIDLYLIDWYQDPAQFFASIPYNITSSSPWTGDGTTTTFSTSVSGAPILPSSLVCTDDVEVFQDTSQTWTDANVTFFGSLGGTLTVNYSTGSISVSFNTAPANGQQIYLSYQLFQPGRPNCVLMYNNQFQFFPVPNTAYRFKVKAYKTLDPLVNSSDTPELEEWGPCIAYGAARDLFVDYGQNDAYAEINVLYKEQLAYVLTRTEQNLLNTRAFPSF